MKLSKKVIAAMSAAVLLAMAGTFVSCGEDDDDEEGAISGSNKNYTVSYTNEGSDTYRAYNTTTFKHLGELVKITINNQTASSVDGAMGFIWDLQDSKDAPSVTEGTTVTKPAATEGKNFLVVAVRNNAGKLEYYVSKYFNVTDLQAKNFGASKTVESHKDGILATEPVELTVSVPDANNGGFTKITDATIEDGNINVWLDVYPVYDGSKYGIKYSETAYAGDVPGAFIVDVYTSDPTATDSTKTTAASVTVYPDDSGYSAKPDQHYLGVYTNILSGKTLNGTWNLAQDYAADEVVED